jgi:phage gp29-like protein
MGGSVADFETLVKACDLQISYAMTGQALATNVSDTGTQALGTVQERTKNAAYENDARALAYTLQKLVRMSIEVNFGFDAEVPEFSFDTGDYAPFANVIQAIGAGVPVSKRALYSRYGLPEPEDEDDALVSQGNIAASTSGFGPFNFADDGESGKKKVRRKMILIR